MNGSVASAQQRMLWMDLLRGVAVFLVIVHHSSSILKRYDMLRPEWMDALNNGIAPFRIPLLMFLSGMLLAASLAKPAEKYFAGKIRNIAYPYVVWSFIFAAVVGVEHAWYHPKFWLGTTYLWYLFFLLFYYCCAFFLRGIRPIVLFAVALIASIFMIEGSKYGERLFYLMAFFFLGHAVGTWPRWESILENKRILVLTPLVVGFGVVSAFYGPLRYGAEYAVPTFIGIVVLCVLARMIMNTKIAAPFVYIGQNGIVFYVAHYPVVHLTIALLAGLGIQSEFSISVVALTAAMGVCFLLSYLASRLWFVRLLFVGPPIDMWLSRRTVADKA